VAFAAPLAVPATASAATPFWAFTTGGQIQLAFVSLPVPGSGTGSLVGAVDDDANTTVPVAGVTLPATAFSANSSGIAVTGTVQLASTQALVGSLNPLTGAMTLTGGIRADVSMSAVVPGVGTLTGTCQLGSSLNPIPVVLTTTPPGASYSPLTAAFTLSGPVVLPMPACSPSLTLIAGVLQSLFGGSGRLTIEGVLALPGFRYAGAVGCNAGSPQLAASVPRVYGHEAASLEYVVARTDFWRLGAAGWELTPSQYVVSYATAFVPTRSWYDLNGNLLGTDAAVLQTTTANPPGGVWLTTQELYWLSEAFQPVAADQLFASRTSGPNAFGGYCRWTNGGVAAQPWRLSPATRPLAPSVLRTLRQHAPPVR
jgi:hypothetical protein